MKYPCKCKVKFCRNVVRETNHNTICAKHASARFKELHPLQYAFNLLRSGARRRGKEFTITFAEYERLALATGYDKAKGRSADCLSLDRIDNRLGYVPGNCRVITVSENSKKWTRLEFTNMPASLREEIRRAA